jgi:hypothetical protein
MGTCYTLATLIKIYKGNHWRSGICGFLELATLAVTIELGLRLTRLGAYQWSWRDFQRTLREALGKSNGSLRVRRDDVRKDCPMWHGIWDWERRVPGTLMYWLCWGPLFCSILLTRAGRREIIRKRVKTTSVEREKVLMTSNGSWHGRNLVFSCTTFWLLISVEQLLSSMKTVEVKRSEEKRRILTTTEDKRYLSLSY